MLTEQTNNSHELSFSYKKDLEKNLILNIFYDFINKKQIKAFFPKTRFLLRSCVLTRGTFFSFSF